MNQISRVRLARCLPPLLLASCASPAEPVRPIGTATVAENSAIEAARRDERQKIMQEYWNEHTVVAADLDGHGGTSGLPPLFYPAGSYRGVNFAPRQAADSYLTEPAR
jgi:hypothetical protein